MEIILDEHSGQLLIVGDLNFHLDDSSNSHATLKQLVKGATHVSGHTLDLLIISDESLVKHVVVRDPTLSDHYAVYCNLCLQNPQFAKKLVNFRKLRSFDMESFREDIRSSSLKQKQATDLDTLASQYDDVQRSLLDHPAPLKQRLVTVRPYAPWYTPELTLEKTKRRRLERKWRTSRLQIDCEKYVHQCSLVIDLISSLKSEYYTSVIREHSGNRRVLFKIVNKLLQKPSVKRYPSCPDNNSLANSSVTFLLAKLISYIVHLLRSKLL